MRSLVEVCAEQRAENWREADAIRERRAQYRNCAREGAGMRLQEIRRAKWASKKARALEMFLAGATKKEVAEILGISHETIKSWIKRAGIRGGGGPVQRADRLNAAQLRHTLRAEGRL